MGTRLNIYIEGINRTLFVDQEESGGGMVVGNESAGNKKHKENGGYVNETEIRLEERTGDPPPPPVPPRNSERRIRDLPPKRLSSTDINGRLSHSGTGRSQPA